MEMIWVSGYHLPVLVWDVVIPVDGPRFIHTLPMVSELIRQATGKVNVYKAMVFQCNPELIVDDGGIYYDVGKLSVGYPLDVIDVYH